jgi:hypothetical protein
VPRPSSCDAEEASMTLRITTGKTALPAALTAVTVAVGLALALTLPEAADAALRSAAGGGGGSGGFDRFVRFVNRLADYTIPVGSAFSVLGLIWGGILFMAGDARAGRVLGLVALGVGVVLLSKPVAA